MPTHQDIPRVLLVDDEPRILSSLKRTLRKEAFELVTTDSAEAAVDLLTSESGGFALVISDQKMPGRSGIELLAEVARRWPRTERILLSGWTGEIPETQVQAASLFSALSKPWDDEELKATIAQALKRSSQP